MKKVNKICILQDTYVYTINSKACSSTRVHQSPCSVSPPNVVVVVVVLGLKALLRQCLILYLLSLRERSSREREKEKRIFRIFTVVYFKLKALGELIV